MTSSPQGRRREMPVPTLQEPWRPEPGGFEEERLEVLASVLASLAVEASDPDHTAACLHLLRHLAGSYRAAPRR